MCRFTTRVGFKKSQWATWVGQTELKILNVPPKFLRLKELGCDLDGLGGGVYCMELCAENLRFDSERAGLKRSKWGCIFSFLDTGY